MSEIAELLDGTPGRLLINGEWRTASGQETIDVVDPATEQTFTTAAAGSVDDALAAVEAAAGAAEGWAATPPIDRAEILRRGFDGMLSNLDILADLIVREMGKARTEALSEVKYAAEFFRWNAGEAVRNLGTVSTAPAGDKRIMAIRQPVGVSLLVTPWNFPAAMATRKIGPAIAAGCTMVLKPASATPLTALAIGRILSDAGLPDGVLNVVPVRHSGDAVAAILADSRVRKLSFTGSTDVGKGLLAQAAERVISCSMELGGNAPFVVLDDADLDAAVDGAMVAKIRNGGQSCVAANRFYVHASVASAFTARLADAMAALEVGPGMQAGVDLGPLISSDARQDMVEVVDEAVGDGAVVVTGGKAPSGPGFFFEPTVLSGLNPDASVLRREIFGPVAPVVTFESDDDAVRLANDTQHGLVAYIYGGELGRAMRVAERIEAAMVGINRGIVSDPAAPFGGVKESGLGREGAHEGLLEFLETKYLAVDW